MIGKGKVLRDFADKAVTSCLLGAGALLFLPAAGAQEVLPDAPAELEGFRLDTPAPAAEAPPPATTNPPTNTPAPPATDSQIPTDLPAPAAENPADTAPSERANTPPPTRSNAPPSGPVNSPPTRSEIAPPVTLSPQQAAAPAPEPTEAALPQREPAKGVLENAGSGQGDQSGQNAWTIWFAIAAVAALLAAALLALVFRRQKQRAPAPAFDQTAAAPRHAEETEAEDDPHVEVTLPETPPAIPASAQSVGVAKTKPKPRAKPELDMRFIPEMATLGMINLTLRGELKIVNHGKAMARNVRLRSAAICACDTQPAKIAAFNAGDIGPEADPIDNIRKGERVSVAIEISLPRAELESYNVDGRQICVPIILAELAYSGMRADSGQQVQIAAMVGREADPPQDKMGPLRIDIGPRSYDMLGQRPISA